MPILLHLYSGVINIRVFFENALDMFLVLVAVVLFVCRSHNVFIACSSNASVKVKFVNHAYAVTVTLLVFCVGLNFEYCVKLPVLMS